MFKFLVRALALAVLLAASSTRAQNVQDVPDTQPRFVLNTGGPTERIVTLAFSPNGDRLYSAGYNKVVQAWELQAAGRRRIRLSAKFVEPLRWEIARGLRGAILSVAASPTDRLLAIGGYSARGATGDIVLYDTAQSQVVAGLRGHTVTVASLAFAPDGKTLASMSVDGELRVWRAPQWRSTVLQPKQARNFDRLPLAFLSDTVLAVPLPSDRAASRWQIGLFDTTQARPNPPLLPQVHQGGVTALAASPEQGLWASADEAGNVFVTQGVDEPQTKILRAGQAALSLALGPNQTLFVATKLEDRDGKPARLEQWDVAAGELLDEVTTAETENNFACAVSPDGAWVATCGGDASDILAYALADADGTPLAKPLSGGRAVVMRGRGSKVGVVRFADDNSRRIAFGPFDYERRLFDDYGDPTQGFDFEAGELLGPDQLPELIDSSQPPRGWAINFPEEGDLRYRVELSSRDGKKTIALDPDKQGHIRSYAFINRRDGAPFAIALGTDHQNGVFIYRLANGADGQYPLIRYFRDHTGWVTSLSVSKDGRYLASGSADQTIKIWSLQTLWKPVAREFRASRAWGATFALQRGRLFVAAVEAGGIAAGRGLRAGDEVRGVEVAGLNARAQRAPDMLRLLESMPLWEQAVIEHVRPNAAPKRIQLVPAWEPLATLFVDQFGEWAVSTPPGFYVASIEGDSLFGWQINRGVDRAPDFFRADAFRERFERPELLKRLLSAGDLPTAFQLVGEEPPEEFRDLVLTAAGDAPVIHIVEPTDGSSFPPGKPVRVVAEVEYPDIRQEGKPVAAYINGVKAKLVQSGDAEGRQRYEWTASSVDQYNMAVIAVGDNASGKESYLFRNVHFQTQTVSPPGKLHLLLIAAKDYPGSLALNKPVQNAEDIERQVPALAKSLYGAGDVRTLYEQEITPQGLKKQFAAFKNAAPQDLLVIYIGGHGEPADGKYYFVPPDARLGTVEDPLSIISQVGLPWEQFSAAADINCRKLILLDTCYSGRALSNAVRPLKQQQMFVVTAANEQQKAFDGIFATAFLEAVAGRADKNGDNIVDVMETIDDLRNSVPEMSKLFGGAGHQPIAAPRDAMSSIFIPITAPKPNASLGQIGSGARGP